jgi:uncharacterized repeat protein (TIGR01451 family)
MLNRLKTLPRNSRFRSVLVCVALCSPWLSGCAQLGSQQTANLLNAGPTLAQSSKVKDKQTKTTTATTTAMAMDSFRESTAPVVPASAVSTAAAASQASAAVPTSEACLDAQYCESCAPTGYPYCQPTGCAACSPAMLMPRRQNVQEYVFDGGDQQPRVIIKKDWTSAGVDPTDTVVYYETETGEICVQPTNRVPIYAPRFGAVRKVRGAKLAAKAVGTQRIVDPVSAGHLEDTELAGSMTLPLATHGEEQVDFIDAFRENRGGTPLEAIVPAERMSRAFVPHEGTEVLGLGRITDEEIAVLGRVLQNARTWYMPESLEVILDTTEAVVITDDRRPQDVHVFETRDKCALRICKTASHTIANPGDVINFAIRFDNAGSKDIGNAVILDSLSPRLEYIEGSQQSSIDARFSAEANEVGSLVLRWEILSTIETSDGGVISFDCRVR